MTRLNMLATAAALALGLTATLAQAESDQRRGYDRPSHSSPSHAGPPSHSHPSYGGPSHARPPSHSRPSFGGPSHSRPGYSGHPGYGHQAHGYRHGAGPQHNWVRGSRVPPQFRSPHYVINDWRGHRLSAPPRGYHWVQNGSDYLLLAIATGVIAQMVLSH